MEPPYIPNYTKYVLPPTPSGSSTDSASSPTFSGDHGEYNMQFYREYYNIPVLSTSSVGNDHLEEGLDHQQCSSSTSSQMELPLYHQAVQKQDFSQWNPANYQSNHAIPYGSNPNPVPNISSEQLRCPLTPSSNNSADDQPPETRIKKRTKFSSLQILQLENAFRNSRYLTKVKKMELSEKLHLDEDRIKVWFQNRRMKDKKYGVVGKNKRRQPKTMCTEPISVKPIQFQPSSSATSRLLTHSVWAKGHQQNSPVLASYGPHNINPYYCNINSSSFHNVSYPMNGEYNQYHCNNSYLGYQHNVPTTSQSNIKVEPSDYDNIGKLDDFALNFGIAHEFLSKAIDSLN